MCSNASRGQIALDYLVIAGLAIGLIVAVVGILALYSGYLSIGMGQGTLSTISNTITGQVNYVYSLAPGSLSTIPANFPVINPISSHFCGKELILSYRNSFFVSNARANMSGLLPTTPGLDDILVRSIEVNGTEEVQVGLYRPISFVGFNYTLANSVLSYTVNFYNHGGSPINFSQLFEISVYSSNETLINSTIEMSNSGTYSGSMLLSSSIAPAIVLVEPSGSGTIFSECI
ncbi:MAG: hypothetical protein QW292_09395 [Candidatus Parvarchaeota archaeon]